MRGLARIYAAFLRISLLGQIQYRASGAIWMLGSILEPLVFLVVWSKVAEAQGGSVGGIEARDFAAYYTVLFVVNHLTFSWIMHTFQFRIQQGQLSFELLRPIHPIHADLSDNLAYKVVMLFIVVPTVVLLVWGFDPAFHWVPLALACSVPALVLGFLLRFFFEWALALAAFWTTRTQAMNMIYFALLMFLSGRVAPLSLLPETLQTIAGALPFYYMIAFPVEVFLGRLSQAAILEGFAIQAIWIGLALAVLMSVCGGALCGASPRWGPDDLPVPHGGGSPMTFLCLMAVAAR